MHEMDADYPQNYQLNAIGTHLLKNNDIIDEPAWPKKLKIYKNVVLMKKTNKLPSHVDKNHVIETINTFCDNGPLFLKCCKGKNGYR